MYIIGLYNQQLCHGQELECISIFFVASGYGMVVPGKQQTWFLIRTYNNCRVWGNDNHDTLW